MSLLDKVKALFAEATPETIFVKTVDGQILLVKAPKLDLNVEIVTVDEAGVEQPLKDGDYVLEDNGIYRVIENDEGEDVDNEEYESIEQEIRSTILADNRLQVFNADIYAYDGQIKTLNCALVCSKEFNNPFDAMNQEM